MDKWFQNSIIKKKEVIDIQASIFFFFVSVRAEKSGRGDGNGRGSKSGSGWDEEVEMEIEMERWTEDGGVGQTTRNLLRNLIYWKICFSGCGARGPSWPDLLPLRRGHAVTFSPALCLCSQCYKDNILLLNVRRNISCSSFQNRRRSPHRLWAFLCRAHKKKCCIKEQVLPIPRPLPPISSCQR